MALSAANPIGEEARTMIKEATIEKLTKMRLGAMAEAFEHQCNDKAFQSLSFEDRFSMIVDKQWEKRQNKKIKNLITTAAFRYPGACMEDIEYLADRKLDRSQMLELSTCSYITDGYHVILKGAAGCGKTYISNALGIAACRNFMKVRYVRLPELFVELEVARAEGSLKKTLKSYKNCDLLILDDFLLTPLTSEETRLLLEIIEVKTIHGSVIFCSQFEIEGWIHRMGTDDDATVAEAIIDRFRHASYIISIKGNKSMRERHGLNAGKRGIR